MKIVGASAFYSPGGGGVKTDVGQKLAIAERMRQDLTIRLTSGELSRAA